MKYLLVDVANLFHRIRHVVRGDAYTKVGMTLHTVFRSLRKLYREQGCDHVVLCLEGRSWRYDIYPAYKSKRKVVQAQARLDDAEEEEVFFATMEEFTNYMAEKTRVTVLHSPGVEGDDFVARWIQLHPTDEHVILSGDTDFIQLLSDKVTIYDGVNNRLITTTGIYDEQGEPLVFRVDGSSGKLKVGLTIEKAEADHRKKQREEATAARKEGKEFKPSEFSFEIEPEWWMKALFIKIIRGDVSDSIFSAYPRVQYTSKSKVGISEAWADRHAKGYIWNNFMLSDWEKAIGVDAEGNPIKKTVSVRDEYAINESLIDLTKQPDRIKDLMDTVIVQAVQKEAVGNVGIHFLKFCAKYELKNLSRESNDHAAYLNSPYSRVK